jgi:hypothetical protein
MITIKNPGSVIVLTREEADKLGIEAKDYQQRLDIETVGPWQIPVKVKGLCIDTLYEKDEWGRPQKVAVTLFGQRTMTNVSQGGYELDGWVSVKGKKYSAYTSAIDVQIDDKYIQVGVIAARVTPFPKD